MQTLSNLSANQILTNIAMNISSALPSLGLDGQHIRRSIPVLNTDGSITEVQDGSIRWTLTTGLSEDKFCQTFSIGVVEFWAVPDANGRPSAGSVSARDTLPWFKEWPASAFPGMWPILLGKTRYEQEDLALAAFQSDETEAVLFVLDQIASERGSDLVTETDAREFRQRQSLRPFDSACIGRIMMKLERMAVECAKEVYNQANHGHFNPQLTYDNGVNTVDSTPRLTLLVWRSAMVLRLTVALGKPTAQGLFGQLKARTAGALAAATAAVSAAQGNLVAGQLALASAISQSTQTALTAAATAAQVSGAQQGLVAAQAVVGLYPEDQVAASALAAAQATLDAALAADTAAQVAAQDARAVQVAAQDAIPVLQAQIGVTADAQLVAGFADEHNALLVALAA